MAMHQCLVRVLALLSCFLAVRAAPPAEPTKAIVTYATNDVYALSAVVLGRTLEAVGHGTADKTELVALVTSTVSSRARALLADVGWDVQEVDAIDPPPANAEGEKLEVSAGGAPEASADRDLSVEFGKLHAWKLRSKRDNQPFGRVLLLDADAFVKQPLHDLFDERFYRGTLTSRYERRHSKAIFIGGMLAFRADPAFPATVLAFARQNASAGMVLQGVLNEQLRAEWQGKAEEERIPVSTHFGVAACVLSGSSPESVSADLVQALVVDFQGVSKPWRWPTSPQTSDPSSPCQPVTRYAQLWAALLALPLTAPPATVLSMLHNVDGNPHTAEGLIVLASQLAQQAMVAQDDPVTAARERERVRLVGEHLGWGLGAVLLQAAGLDDEVGGPGEEMGGGAEKRGTRHAERGRMGRNHEEL